VIFFVITQTSMSAFSPHMAKMSALRKLVMIGLVYCASV